MNDAAIEFNDLYQQYHLPITHYMVEMLGPSEAVDVTQEVFAKIHQGLAGFEGRAKISTWIYRIATNAALDRLRKAPTKRPENLLPIEDADTETLSPETPINAKMHNPLDQVIHSEMNDCIREQVFKLPDRYRTVIVLNSLEELRNGEIAAILDLSVGAVKIRLHRARAMLKKILETQCHFYHNPTTGILACDRKVSPRS